MCSIADRASQTFPSSHSPNQVGLSLIDDALRRLHLNDYYHSISCQQYPDSSTQIPSLIRRIVGAWNPSNPRNPGQPREPNLPSSSPLLRLPSSCTRGEQAHDELRIHMPACQQINLNMRLQQVSSKGDALHTTIVTRRGRPKVTTSSFRTTYVWYTTHQLPGRQSHLNA